MDRCRCTSRCLVYRWLNLNTARTTAAGAGASNASGLTFGGSPIPGVAGKTELYDGTSWTEVNDLNKGGTGLGRYRNFYLCNSFWERRSSTYRSKS